MQNVLELDSNSYKKTTTKKKTSAKIQSEIESFPPARPKDTQICY